VLGPLALVALLAGSWLVYLGRTYPTASPFTSALYVVQQTGHPHAAMQREVLGFLPYWQQQAAGYAPLSLLSEVVFFSLTADAQGHFVAEKDGKPEPGWAAWHSASLRDFIARTQIAGSKFALSISQQDGVQLGAFLDSPAAQQSLIGNAAAEVANNHLDGLNLDFEFTGASTPAHREVFTDFSRTLVAAVHARSPKAEVSIDLPAISAARPGLYDVAALGQTFDRVIVMSYDYYTPGSDVAAPDAPISGRTDRQYFFDVTTTYDGYSQAVTPAKLLMGVPYYGYDWPVDDNSKPLPAVLPQNDTNGYAEVVSYSRAKTEANLAGHNCQWDDTAQETRCAYTDPRTGVQRLAWLEDDRSITAKFDFAKQRQLAGVALWTLGYAGAEPQPWDVVRREFVGG
jgi:spore germination protein YaaH